MVYFSETDQGTQVELTHLGFGAAPHWEETFDYFSKAWQHVLAQFKTQLEKSAG